MAVTLAFAIRLVAAAEIVEEHRAKDTSNDQGTMRTDLRPFYLCLKTPETSSKAALRRAAKIWGWPPVSGVLLRRLQQRLQQSFLTVRPMRPHCFCTGTFEDGLDKAAGFDCASLWAASCFAG